MSLFGCASDEQFLDELHDEIFSLDEENPYRESKCDYCNCALRDCSLCGVTDED